VSTTAASRKASNGAELALFCTAPRPALAGLPPAPGTFEDDPNPFDECTSEPGCPPGTSTGLLLPSLVWTAVSAAVEPELLPVALPAEPEPPAAVPAPLDPDPDPPEPPPVVAPAPAPELLLLL
jgi:hypothetical protein